MNVNPSIQYLVTVERSFPVLWIVHAVFGAKHSESGHGLTILLPVDTDAWKAAEFTCLSITLQSSPLWEIITDELVINLVFVEKESKHVTTSVSEAKVFNSDLVFSVLSLC